MDPFLELLELRIPIRSPKLISLHSDLLSAIFKRKLEGGRWGKRNGKGGEIFHTLNLTYTPKLHATKPTSIPYK